MSSMFERLNAALEDHEEFSQYTGDELESMLFDDDGEIEQVETTKEIDQINTDLETLEETSESLEYYSEALEHYGENGGVHPQAISMIRGHLYDAMAALGVKNGIGNESFDGDATAALESISETAKKVWEAIKKMLKKLMENINHFWNAISLRRLRLDKKLANLCTNVLPKLSGKCPSSVTIRNPYMFMNGALQRGAMGNQTLDNYVKDFTNFYKGAIRDTLFSNAERALKKAETAKESTPTHVKVYEVEEVVYRDMYELVKNITQLATRTPGGKLAAMSLPGDVALIVDLGEGVEYDSSRMALRALSRNFKVYFGNTGGPKCEPFEIWGRSANDLQRDAEKLRSILKHEEQAAKEVRSKMMRLKIGAISDSLTNRRVNAFSVMAKFVRQIMSSPVSLRNAFVSCVDAQISSIHAEAKLFKTEK